MEATRPINSMVEVKDLHSGDVLMVEGRNVC
jgi:hypothetical protein